MGSCFGAGLSGQLDAGTDGEDALPAFEEFAALNLCRRFREVIDGRVIEFAYDDGEVGQRWLDTRRTSVHAMRETAYPQSSTAPEAATRASPP